MSSYLHEVCLRLHDLSLTLSIISSVAMLVSVIHWQVDEEIGYINDKSRRAAKKLAITTSVICIISVIAYIFIPVT